MSEWVEKVTSKNQPKDAAFEIKIGHYRLFITKGHIYYPNEWIMHLGPGHLADTLRLNLDGDTAVDTVKETALRLAIDLLGKQARLTSAALNIAQAALDAAGGSDD